MTGRRRDDAGATSVEFALVMPILLMVIGIGAWFGWAAYLQAQVDRAAARAARYGAVPTTSGVWAFCKDDLLSKLNADFVGTRVAAAELSVRDRNGAAPQSCTPAKQPAGYVRVRLQHTYQNPFTPVIALLTPLSGSATIVGSGQVRVEAP